MKKVVALLLVMVMAVGLLAGCGNDTAYLADSHMDTSCPERYVRA